jgi:Flp pilus assembly protein TadG
MSATRGSTSTELVIAFPVVLLIILLALQLGMYLHAAQIAEAAAQEAVEAAQREGALASAGQSAARSLLAQLGALRRPDVHVERTTTTVTAHVNGHAQQVIPGFVLQISAAAEGPVERFVPETTR